MALHPGMKKKLQSDRDVKSHIYLKGCDARLSGTHKYFHSTAFYLSHVTGAQALAYDDIVVGSEQVTEHGAQSIAHLFLLFTHKHVCTRPLRFPHHLKCTHFDISLLLPHPDTVPFLVCLFCFRPMQAIPRLGCVMMHKSEGILKLNL